MSFLGVGAPEALLVGVVALVVFGPKGLADAARSIGTTLKAFQPTIKEVIEVSQDIKGSLEKELGLNELRESTRMPARMPPRTQELTGEDDSDLESKRRASASTAWNTTSPSPMPSTLGQQDSPPAAGPQPQAQAPPPQTAAAPPTPLFPAAPAAALSIEELEAELARRKVAAVGQRDSV